MDGDVLTSHGDLIALDLIVMLASDYAVSLGCCHSLKNLRDMRLKGGVFLSQVGNEVCQCFHISNYFFNLHNLLDLFDMTL
mmetsp:Transcript_6420/g.9977  ORF Transcript_6420/g.9977 Transcript_6420/m.9977 type:complete len:81 (+) Transcript_6420:420-662(+)